MKTAQSECPGPDRQRLSGVLADETARRLLCRLHSGPGTPADLAASLAAAERNCSAAAVTPEEQRRYEHRLHHDYLPRLEDAGLVDHDAGQLVRLTALPTDQFAVTFPAVEAPDDPAWDAVATVLARQYRYPLLSLLADADGPVPLSVLAANLAEAAPDAADTSRELSVALHHVDLPKLEAVGVVTYDLGERTAAATPDAETVL